MFLIVLWSLCSYWGSYMTLTSGWPCSTRQRWWKYLVRFVFKFLWLFPVVHFGKLYIFLTHTIREQAARSVWLWVCVPCVKQTSSQPDMREADLLIRSPIRAYWKSDDALHVCLQASSHFTYCLCYSWSAYLIYPISERTRAFKTMDCSHPSL